jgi:hypothetical protein
VRLLVLVFLAFFLMAAAAPDAAIEKSLKARLMRSKLKQDGLTFVVKDGVVEWKGEVGVPQRKGTATRMAKAAGATRVVNGIVVRRGAGKEREMRGGLRVVKVQK